jgi:hypothetical protein
MGMLTRVPTRVGEDGKILNVGYEYGIVPPIDPEAFRDELTSKTRNFRGYIRVHHYRYNDKWILDPMYQYS